MLSLTSSYLNISILLLFQAVETQVGAETLGSDKAIFGFRYSEATYKNLDEYSNWSSDALTKIATNMNNQHTSMRQHLQDRHLAMEINIGQDIFDAQNAIGQGIVDAQNANGQAIVDARNAMSDQHNRMLQWIKPTLCTVYAAALGGMCETFVGPLLEEDQDHIPFELHWPEGQPSLMERLKQIESKVDDGKRSDDETMISSSRNLWVAGTDAKAMELLKEHVNEMKSKMEDSNRKMEDNMAEMGEKVGAIEDSMKEMKEMMSQIMKMMG